MRARARLIPSLIIVVVLVPTALADLAGQEDRATAVPVFVDSHEPSWNISAEACADVSLPVQVPLHGVNNQSYCAPGGVGRTIRPVLDDCAPGLGTGGLTGSRGIQPITAVRSPLAPQVTIDWLDGGSTCDAQGIHYGARAHGNITAPAGTRLSRVEVTVTGSESWWRDCPAISLQDPLDPATCILNEWHDDGTRCGAESGPAETFGCGSGAWMFFIPTALALCHVDQQASCYPPLQLFMPGNYRLAIRAYASGGADTQLRPVDATGLLTDPQHEYGSAYQIAIRIDNLFGSINGAPPVGATHGTTITGVTTEPAGVDLTISGGASCDTVIATLHGATTLANDTDAYRSQGYDKFALAWDGLLADGTPAPEGFYCVGLTLHAVLSNDSWTRDTGWSGLAVDRTPPDAHVHTDGLPSPVTAADLSPQGTFNLTIPTDSLKLITQNGTTLLVRNGTPWTRVDLWVKDDVLGADGSVVHEGAWQLAYDGRPPTSRFSNDGTWELVVPFAPALDGANHSYAFAAWATDQAGNCLVADPSLTPPTVADSTIIFNTS